MNEENTKFRTMLKKSLRKHTKSKSKRKYKVAFVVMVVMLCFLIMYLKHNNYFTFTDLHGNSLVLPTIAYQKPTPGLKYKRILIWHNLMGIHIADYLTSHKLFQNCGVKSCYISTNKTDLKIEDFDAIIFNVPAFKNGYDLPKRRSVEQYYIFYSFLSPYEVNFHTSLNKNFYNLTMTYRKDSDIYAPYALVAGSRTNYQLPNKYWIESKSRFLACFTTIPTTNGTLKSIKFLKELRKYINVEIFKEEIYSFSIHIFKVVEKTYKFYLVIERHDCEDYITNLLFDILSYNIIPVVFGYKKFTNFLPPYSYINANDFSNAYELAMYLLKVSEDDVSYMQFLEWKKNYIIVDSLNDTLCRLCETVNTINQSKTYSNIRDWFFGAKCYD